jgi:hypothetical protein
MAAESDAVATPEADAKGQQTANANCELDADSNHDDRGTVDEPKTAWQPDIDGVGDKDEVEQADVTMDDIRDKLSIEDPRQLALLRLYEARYQVESPVDALMHIKNFLGVYMVCDFNHEQFCTDLRESLGLDKGDEGLAPSVDVKHDLNLAATVMLRLAAMVAKVHGLQMSDWEDVNEACSSALRVVPACYALKRSLPGALNWARASRFLQDGNEDESGSSAPNPWKSEEDKESFERLFEIDWQDISAMTSHDDDVVCCFSGAFMVVDVRGSDNGGLCIVSLEAQLIGEAPYGYPAKDIVIEDTVFWEVEGRVGSLLEPGIIIEADFYEVNNEVCFLSSLNSVFPRWVEL